MKKLPILFTLIFIIYPTVYANDLVIDVFEEYASFTDEEFKTNEINLATNINTPVKGAFSVFAKDDYMVEITTQPKHGVLNVDANSIQFSYTPDKNFCGNDIFYYRVSDGKISSNISKCLISVGTEKQTASAGFFYADMAENVFGHSAKKLAELDILKGEKIGTDYYFYPKAQVTRAMAVSCLARADKYNNMSKDKSTQVFADENMLSSQLKNDAYIATNSGIINGVKENGKYYLKLDEPITRAEFFTMIDRAMLQKTQSDIQPLYADKAIIPDYAKTSIKNLIFRKINHKSNKKLK